MLGTDLWTVLLIRNVKVSETPVDELQLAALVVNHDVARLDIPVHDAFGVRIVKSFEQLIHVEADVGVREAV